MPNPQSAAPLARAGLIALLLIWAGMLIGVSFLAAPAKFQAPSLTLPVALDVGRHVFGTYNRVEMALAGLSVALAFLGRPRRASWLVLVPVWLIVALQSLWLLPALDARVDMILRGVEPPPAPWHVLYVVLELIKLAGLFAAALWCARSRRLLDQRTV